MQKRNFLQATVISAVLGLGFVSVMPAANATNLIPQREGEIETTNLGCIVSAANCIKSSELGFTVTSLEYQDIDGNTYAPSRLFVDKGATENNWGGGIRFGFTDLGTNTSRDEYWLRPVAYDGSGRVRENGQLEVGRFRFDFGQKMAEIFLELFDIEDAFKTGILATDGIFETNAVARDGLLDQHGDNGKSSITLRNATYFVLQLGNTGRDSVFRRTGDGVRLSGFAVSRSVPEPSAAIGFGLLATAGTFGLKKRKKISAEIGN